LSDRPPSAFRLPLSADPHLRRGRLLLIAAALLWSTTGVVLKSPPLEQLPLEMRGPILACYRAAFALVFLLPFVRWKRIRWRPALLPMALCFGAMNLLYITALTRTTAAAAIFLQYTSSIWAFVFGWLFLKERIDRANLLALLLAVAGIAWIVAGDWGGEHAAGNLLALGAGLSYAGVILCLRQLRDEDSAWLIAVNHAVSFVILLPWVAVAGRVEIDAVQWSLIAALGVAGMALPYVIFARGIRNVPTQEAGLLLLLEPILNPVWVALAWGEENRTEVWIGGGLILSGLAVRYLLIPAGRALRQRRAGR
jgi:drug/metabolite transporter (DMT)-like permease